MWYEIPNIKSNYKVNKNGVFINEDTGKVLKGEKMNKGYIRMNLIGKYNERIRAMAHVLVAVTFIGEPPTKQHQINHKNSKTSDNRLSNLEWVTSQENIDHKMENMCPKQYVAQQRLMSEVGKKYGYINGKRSAKPVAQIDKDTGEVIKTYKSAREAYRMDGFSYKGISRVCTGERPAYLGYIWKFVE